MATDNFDRADGVVGTNWSTPSGGYDLTISSNQVTGANATNCGWWNAVSFANNQYSEIKIIDNHGNIGPTVRMSGSLSALNYYKFQKCSWDAVVRIMKRVAGTETAVGADYTESISNGDTVRLSISGNVLTPYINGTPLATRTDVDSSLASGSAGIHLNGGTGGTADDWVAGDVAGDETLYARSTIANAIDWTGTEMILGPLQMIAWSCAGAAGEPGAPTYTPTLMMMGMGN
jgi:hypothetical protein